MNSMAFRSALLAAFTTGAMLVQASGHASQHGPPGRDTRCDGAPNAGRGLCTAYIAQECELRFHRSCAVLRQLYYRSTGVPHFPFELAGTPIPTAAVTPTPTPTGGVIEVGPRAASLLIFPRVLATTERDTWIQLGNTSSSTTYAHCFYLNGAPEDLTMPPSSTNPPAWSSIDFILSLTGDQPTQWRTSSGRPFHIPDPPGSPGAGLDPAAIPPVPIPFTGELRCFQSNASGAPAGGNALTGTATLFGPTEEVAGYDAIAFRGLDVDGDLTLRLDGAEYESCPQAMYFLHRSDGVLFPGTVPVTSTISITVIPCTADYDHQLPVRANLVGIFTDEFEVILSNSVPVDYWTELGVDELFVIAKDFAGDDLKLSKLMPASSKVCIGGPTPGEICQSDSACGPSATCAVVPLLAVIETTVAGPAAKLIDIQNPHFSGSIPSGYIRSYAPFTP